MPFRRLFGGSITGGGNEQGEGRQPLSTDLTVTVGPGGDYGTINNALADLYEKYYPIYTARGFTVQIRLLSGFVMAEQVLIKNLDMGWMQICGEDQEIAIIRSTLTENFGMGYPAFGVIGGTLPELNCTFVMDDSGIAQERNGIVAISGSHAVLSSWAGVKNAGMFGMFIANGSIASTEFADMSGAGLRGIVVDGVSIVEALSVDVSNCSQAGVSASGGSFVDMSFSAAINCLFGCVAENCAIINANNANASGAEEYGFAVFSGGIINASEATGTLIQPENVLTDKGVIFKGTTFGDYLFN